MTFRDVAPLTDDDFTQEELDSIFGFDEEEDTIPFTEDSIVAKQVSQRDAVSLIIKEGASRLSRRELHFIHRKEVCPRQGASDSSTSGDGQHLW